MNYYVYENEKGATNYEKEEAVKKFLESKDKEYTALGINKGFLSVDLMIKGAYIKDPKMLSYKLSSDYLSSTLYEEKPEEVKNIIETLGKLFVQNSISEKVKDIS